MQIEIVYFVMFGMIFLDFVLGDISDQRSNFVEKDDISLFEIFL